MNTNYIHQHDLNYPSAQLKVLGSDAPERITALGNADILQNKKLALFCSSRCPGKLILQTYDLAKQWLQERFTVIGGFTHLWSGNS